MWVFNFYLYTPYYNCTSNMLLMLLHFQSYSGLRIVRLAFEEIEKENAIMQNKQTASKGQHMHVIWSDPPPPFSSLHIRAAALEMFSCMKFEQTKFSPGEADFCFDDLNTTVLLSFFVWATFNSVVFPFSCPPLSMFFIWLERFVFYCFRNIKNKCHWDGKWWYPEICFN